MDIRSKFGFRAKESLNTNNYFKGKKYSLLETISVFKYKAYKDVNVDKDVVLNVLNKLRGLTDKIVVANNDETKDIFMQLSFELGLFCSDFNTLCVQLDIGNPLINLTMEEILSELQILKSIDEEFFSISNEKCIEIDKSFRMYDTLFYLNNHCIYTPQLSDEETKELYDDIDKNINKLKEFIRARESCVVNEDLAFHIGTLIEALGTVAYDYDLPNELNLAFDTKFDYILNTLYLAFGQIGRFNIIDINSIKNENLTKNNLNKDTIAKKVEDTVE